MTLDIIIWKYFSITIWAFLLRIKKTRPICYENYQRLRRKNNRKQINKHNRLLQLWCHVFGGSLRMFERIIWLLTFTHTFHTKNYILFLKLYFLFFCISQFLSFPFFFLSNHVRFEINNENDQSNWSSLTDDSSYFIWQQFTIFYSLVGYCDRIESKRQSCKF